MPDMLGDVVISVPTAWRQAIEAGRSLDEELAWLLVHGILHLCGYDHERSEKEARRMHRRERMVLRSIGRLAYEHPASDSNTSRVDLWDGCSD